jgi:hypothetical protein
MLFFFSCINQTYDIIKGHANLQKKYFNNVYETSACYKFKYVH